MRMRVRKFFFCTVGARMICDRDWRNFCGFLFSTMKRAVSEIPCCDILFQVLMMSLVTLAEFESFRINREPPGLEALNKNFDFNLTVSIKFCFYSGL